MKQFLIAGNIVLLGIIFFQACNNANLRTGCKEKVWKDYTNAEWHGAIDSATASELANNYFESEGKKFIWNGVVNTGILDTRRIWYSLDSIKKFLWEIEYNSCENNCRDTLGVHIYFAKYPDSIACARMNINPGYANHHTIFMVPTYWDPLLQRHIDFDPSDSCRRRISNKNRIFLFGAGNTIGDSREQNHGNLAPPPDTTGSFPSN